MKEEEMKCLVLSTAVAAAVVGSTIVVAAAGIAARRGCVLRSVNKSAYVAANERVFKTVPVLRRARRVNTYSIGIPSPDACLPRENGPPYSAYGTWHVYEIPRGMTPSSVLGFYRRRLSQTWQLRVSMPTEATFGRGVASLYVAATRQDQYRPAYLLLNVDHAGYAGRGH
jgi:hypothetical protein